MNPEPEHSEASPPELVGPPVSLSGSVGKPGPGAKNSELKEDRGGDKHNHHSKNSEGFLRMVGGAIIL